MNIPRSVHSESTTGPTVLNCNITNGTPCHVSDDAEGTHRQRNQQPSPPTPWRELYDDDGSPHPTQEDVTDIADINTTPFPPSLPATSLAYPLPSPSPEPSTAGTQPLPPVLDPLPLDSLPAPTRPTHSDPDPFPTTTIALLTPTPPQPTRLLSPSLFRQFIRTRPEFRQSQFCTVLLSSPLVFATVHQD